MEQKIIDENWALWCECLVGKDVNSINQQIFRMIWDTAIFHIINKSPMVNVNTAKEEAVNSPLFFFIVRNYSEAQCGIIRRLIDGYSLTDKKRGVYSLISLIKDIQAHREELTRSEYLRLLNIPYDYEETLTREKKYLKENSKGSFITIPREFNSELVSEIHKKFDCLSGKKESERTAADTINDEVFINLYKKINEYKNIQNYVNKYIAHSASPESINRLPPDKLKVTFGEIWDAHQTIIMVADFLKQVLQAPISDPLIIEPNDFFTRWDNPFYTSENLDQVREVFQSYRKTTEEWSSNRQHFFDSNNSE